MGNPKAPKQTEKGNHLVETVGNLMYGVYIIGAVVVLINMLIAMMSNTFEEIQDDEDVEWKFARAKLWISFIDGSGTLPIPFNIIPTPKSIFKIFVYFKKIFMRYLLHSGDEPTSPSTIIDYEYKTILHKVVLRYIHKMKYDKKGDVVRDEIFDAKEEIISNVLNVHTKLNTRMDAIEFNLMGLEAKIPSGNIYAANQAADYCSTDTIAHDNRSLHGNQSLNASPTLKEQQRSHQDSRQNLLSASRQSFTTEAQCHSAEEQDWCDRGSRFGSSKSDGRPSRPRKQMDSVTEYEMSRSVPLHNKYFSHEV